MFTLSAAVATMLAAQATSSFHATYSGRLSGTDTVDTIELRVPAGASIDLDVDGSGSGSNELEVRVQIDYLVWLSLKTKVLNMPSDSTSFTVGVPDYTSGTSYEDIRVRLSRKLGTSAIDWRVEMRY